MREKKKNREKRKLWMLLKAHNIITDTPGLKHCLKLNVTYW